MHYNCKIKYLTYIIWIYTCICISHEKTSFTQNLPLSPVGKGEIIPHSSFERLKGMIFPKKRISDPPMSPQQEERIRNTWVEKLGTKVIISCSNEETRSILKRENYGKTTMGEGLKSPRITCPEMTDTCFWDLVNPVF